MLELNHHTIHREHHILHKNPDLLFSHQLDLPNFARINNDCHSWIYSWLYNSGLTPILVGVKISENTNN